MDQQTTNEVGAIVEQSGDEKIIDRNAPDPAEERRKLVTEWSARVRDAKTHWSSSFKQMQEDMRFCAGDQWKGTNPKILEDLGIASEDRYQANIVLRHVQTRTANIYGKNPRIVARRKNRLLSTVWNGSMQQLVEAQGMLDAVAQDPNAMNDPKAMQVAAAAGAITEDAAQQQKQNEFLDKYARTLELLTEHELDEQPLPFKQQMKATVRRGLTTCVGFVKVGYTRVMGRTPEDENAILDITRRLARVEQLSADLADGEIQEDDPEVEELRLGMQALSEKEDVIVREGLTLSYPDSTAVIPDPDCVQLRGFVGCEWVAEEYFLTAARIQQIYEVDVKSPNGGGDAKARATEYNVKGSAGPGATFEQAEPGIESKAETFFCVWEIYNKGDGLVYTICDGHNDFLLEPGEPDVRVDRYWPWFPFVTNEVYSPAHVYPPSDVRLMRGVQTELNRSRQGLREHRRANRPRHVATQGLLSTEDKDKLANCEANDLVEVQGLPPDRKIEDVMQPMRGVPIDPALYETGPFYEDYLRTLGQQEANLGGTSGATATEASIAESSRRSDASAVVDDLDEFLSELARAVGQVLIRECSPEKVKRIVGPGAVWPGLSAQDTAEEIYLEVEAGSTGRPNKSQEVQVATQVFPLLMQVPGLSPEWLAREMLRRMDDRIDLSDAFAAGMPSIQSMNAAGGTGGPPQPGGAPGGDDPKAQGSEGSNNAPSTSAPQVNSAPRPPEAPPATAGAY